MIDWGRVADLRTEIGPDDFDEVVTLFLDEADDVIARLTGTQPTALRDDLHFLKGAALNLGFRTLAHLCAEGERLSNTGQPVDLTGLLDAYATSRDVFVAKHKSAAA